MKTGVGALLRAVRERARLSQEDIAEKLNRSRSSISKLESEQQALDVQTLVHWTEVAGAKEVAIALLYGMDGLQILQNLTAILGG
nr:helix-turn-helix transcriptional regulator [Aneurinibacillus sp. XH2]